jgi:glycine C-acetyltransferase
VTAPDAAACLAALDLLEESTELVDRLWDNAKYFKAEMQKLGFNTGVSTTPITPIMLGEAPLAQQFSRELSSSRCVRHVDRLPHRSARQGAIRG